MHALFLSDNIFADSFKFPPLLNKNRESSPHGVLMPKEFNEITRAFFNMPVSFLDWIPSSISETKNCTPEHDLSHISRVLALCPLQLLYFWKVCMTMRSNYIFFAHSIQFLTYMHLSAIYIVRMWVEIQETCKDIFPWHFFQFHAHITVDWRT